MLRVSDNGRYLVESDGTPFFWMGDTGWGLIHRLTVEDADLYLSDRASKGFNVIQANLIAPGRLDGLGPNAYGHTPLIDNDPTRPNPAHYDHADTVIRRAESLGLYVALVPVWGAVYVAGYQDGPQIFDDANARAYGAFLGARYRDRDNIVWVLGGDLPVVVEDRDYSSLWRAMAEGIRAEDRSGHLMTFHPRGGQTSATWLHDEDWLDFNMIQSGHSPGRDNYSMIGDDYGRVPPKPCVDAENGYEDHAAAFKPGTGWLNDHNVRKGAYRAVFAGAFGHTYGCHDVWQFWEPGIPPVTHARTPWRQAIHLPGAYQMQHLRRLIESRPFLMRIPDQSLVASNPDDVDRHVRATRGSDGSYAFVYIPSGEPVTVRMDRLSGSAVVAAWYNPHNGTMTPIGRFRNRGEREFIPPLSGAENDWVLVLDDADRAYPPPGPTYVAASG